MEAGSIINLLITAACLVILIFFFNTREKKLHKFAEGKFNKFKQRYIAELAQRKMKERQEILKLKKIVEQMEKQHKAILVEKNSRVQANYDEQVQEIIKQAHERAKKMEDEMREEARKFLEEQKKEVQTKMVDLVIGVTKRVLSKSLTYTEQKQLVESALQEMEGEELNG